MKPEYNGATTTKNTIFYTRSPDFLANTKQAKAATKNNLAQKNTGEKIKPAYISATTTKGAFCGAIPARRREHDLQQNERRTQAKATGRGPGATTIMIIKKYQYSTTTTTITLSYGHPDFNRR